MEIKFDEKELDEKIEKLEKIRDLLKEINELQGVKTHTPPYPYIWYKTWSL